MTIWRPLLKIPKKDLYAYAEHNQLPFFKDETNEDPRFLRGRLRTHLFPYLSENFGKEVVPSLCRLSDYSIELEEFLETLLPPYRLHMEFNEKGGFSILKKNLTPCLNGS